MSDEEFQLHSQEGYLLSNNINNSQISYDKREEMHLDNAMFDFGNDI